MKTIWKYELVELINEIRLPQGAEILHVREQHNKVCIWAEIDDSVVVDHLYEKRTFVLAGTGHQKPDGELTYLGTAMLDGGDIVMHVYEAINPILHDKQCKGLEGRNETT